MGQLSQSARPRSLRWLGVFALALTITASATVTHVHGAARADDCVVCHVTHSPFTPATPFAWAAPPPVTVIARAWTLASSRPIPPIQAPSPRGPPSRSV